MDSEVLYLASGDPRKIGVFIIAIVISILIILVISLRLEKSRVGAGLAFAIISSVPIGLFFFVEFKNWSYLERLQKIEPETISGTFNGVSAEFNAYVRFDLSEISFSVYGNESNNQCLSDVSLVKSLDKGSQLNIKYYNLENNRSCIVKMILLN